MPVAQRRLVAWNSDVTIMSVASLFTASASGTMSASSDSPLRFRSRGRFTSGTTGTAPSGFGSDWSNAHGRLRVSARRRGVRRVPHDLIRQVQGGVLDAVIPPPLQRRVHGARAGLVRHRHLVRGLGGDPRRLRVVVVAPHRQERPAMHQRVDVRELRPLVEVVGLPDAPELVVGLTTHTEAEALDVRAALHRVHDHPRPVDDQRREPVADLPTIHPLLVGAVVTPWTARPQP
jgi:hypothetical protein